jgi:hypothetical protein
LERILHSVGAPAACMTRLAARAEAAAAGRAPGMRAERQLTAKGSRAEAAAALRRRRRVVAEAARGKLAETHLMVEEVLGEPAYKTIFPARQSGTPGAGAARSTMAPLAPAGKVVGARGKTLSRPIRTVKPARRIPAAGAARPHMLMVALAARAS